MSPLLLSLLVSSVISSPPSLCAPGQLDVGGVDAVAAAKGRLLLAVKSPLQCRDCHKHLKEFSLMAESITDLAVVIIVPDSESPAAVRHSKLEFPRLQILHDVYATTADWKNEDQMLFDRCGRLSRLISARPGAVAYRDALDAVRSALSHAQCGWCQYDTRGSRDLSRKQLNAYLREDQGERDRRNDYGRQQPQNQWNQDYRRPPPTQNYRQPAQRQQQQQQYGQYQQHGRQEQQQHYGQQYEQRYPLENRNYQQNNYNRDQYQEQQQRQQQNQQNYQPSTAGYGRQQQQQDSRYPQRNPQQTEATWMAKTSTTTTTTPGPRNQYAEDSDYGDYDISSSSKTTVRPETQIPRPAPESSSVWWPTPSIPTQDPRLFMNGDVPCAAYTDDICFLQQEKLGRSAMPKCCSKGVYLTDLCVPGKCSNSTVQLCCLQKFLQAKFSCCEDESQSNGTSATNQFSRCCYSKFVMNGEKPVVEDDCCPSDAAASYWSSVHDLCYPNTRVDLSNVRLEVRFAEGVRVIDLGENRVWDHECRHGGNRLQLAFSP